MDELTVLYVEDDDQEAFIMQMGMRRHGIQIVHVAPQSGDLPARIGQPPYDQASALLIDAVLGATSGLEVARALREAGDARPIYLLTAGENPNPGLLEALGIGFLRKPVNFPALAAQLRG